MLNDLLNILKYNIIYTAHNAKVLKKNLSAETLNYNSSMKCKSEINLV